MVALVAGLVCFAVYLRSLACGFVNYEDPEYVIGNPVIRHFDKDFWYWAFTTVPLNFWVPLLWVSFALDYHFWGLDPTGYHLTNVILHAVNTGLVVLIADRFYRSSLLARAEYAGSRYLYPALLLLAALLFGIHPARVESVAWITERKDVLNGLFALASVYFYLRYQEKKGAGGHQSAGRDYIVSLVLFLLSLMAKPGSIFMPFALLVMDWYPLGRVQKGRVRTLLLEKGAYLLLATPVIAASIIGRALQGGYNSLMDFPFAVRLVAAGNSILEYFRLMLFPVGILPYYHLPRPVPTLYIFKAGITYALLCCLVVCLVKGKWPRLVSLALSFVVTLFPVLHFFADGYQVILAPRYTYLASLLPVVIVAAMLVNGYLRLAAWRNGAGSLFASLVVALLLFYGVTSYRLIGDWHDSGTMWSTVIAHQPFEKAYFYRGEYLASQGRYLDAVNDYTTCITLSAGITGPRIYNVYAFRGYALMKAGYYPDALDDFTTALSMYTHPLYYYYRGLVLRELGRFVDAEEDFRRAGPVDGQLSWME
jgi:biotin transporter BioY